MHSQFCMLPQITSTHTWSIMIQKLAIFTFCRDKGWVILNKGWGMRYKRWKWEWRKKKWRTNISANRLNSRFYRNVANGFLENLLLADIVFIGCSLKMSFIQIVWELLTNCLSAVLGGLCFIVILEFMKTYTMNILKSCVTNLFWYYIFNLSTNVFVGNYFF